MKDPPDRLQMGGRGPHTVAVLLGIQRPSQSFTGLPLQYLSSVTIALQLHPEGGRAGTFLQGSARLGHFVLADRASRRTGWTGTSSLSGIKQSVTTVTDRWRADRPVERQPQGAVRSVVAGHGSCQEIAIRWTMRSRSMNAFLWQSDLLASARSREGTSVWTMMQDAA
jgi:hypothetical protein